jgi:hypothetical protein
MPGQKQQLGLFQAALVRLVLFLPAVFVPVTASRIARAASSPRAHGARS